MLCGSRNWDGPGPGSPQDEIRSPLAVNRCTRALPYPSTTYISPEGAIPIPVGRLNGAPPWVMDAIRSKRSSASR